MKKMTRPELPVQTLTRRGGPRGIDHAGSGRVLAVGSPGGVLGGDGGQPGGGGGLAVVAHLPHAAEVVGVRLDAAAGLSGTHRRAPVCWWCWRQTQPRWLKEMHVRYSLSVYS